MNRADHRPYPYEAGNSGKRRTIYEISVTHSSAHGEKSKRETQSRKGWKLQLGVREKAQFGPHWTPFSPLLQKYVLRGQKCYFLVLTAQGTIHGY